jgi:tetratricopeptide (TPR) repeat protein
MSDPDLDDGLDELEEQRAERKKLIKWIVAGVVVCLILLAIGGKLIHGGKKDAARLRMRSAVAKFEANPVDADLAKAAANEYEALGKKAEAAKVMEKHQAALAGGEKGREAELRAKLAADPTDDLALGQLVEVFVKRKDLEGAKKTYAEFIGKSATPKRHGTYGAWLYRNNFFEPASKELAAAIKGGNDDAYTRGYLGLAYYELGRKKEAQKLIDKAVEDRADMDSLRIHQVMLDEELGAQPDSPAPAKKPAKQK